MTDDLSTSREITARELDCMRLLLAGRDTKEAAAALGIARSTFDKHLASVRRKIGVSKTSHAMLKLSAIDHSTLSPEPMRAANGDTDIRTGQDFATRLEHCKSLTQAWHELTLHVAELGVEHLNFGIVAEPEGSLTNGGRILMTTLGPDLIDIYNSAGGPRIDPLIPHIVNSTDQRLFDNETVIRTHTQNSPSRIREAVEFFIQGTVRFMLVKPERDRLTGAPYAVVYGLPSNVAADIQQHPDELSSKLRVATRLFWKHIVSAGNLAQFSELTNRQREALTFVARGFATAEVADHMNVSLRSVEKLLAAARHNLGAPTTAAAVYRSIVYRALL